MRTSTVKAFRLAHLDLAPKGDSSMLKSGFGALCARRTSVDSLREHLGISFISLTVLGH
jgi:hypothetical protein